LPADAPPSKYDPKGIFYTKEKAELLCQMIMEGKTLREIALLDGMPARVTVFFWLCKNKEFAEMYDRAREFQAEHMDDLIVECAQNANRTNFQAARVKIQAYQWRAERLNPKRYASTAKLEAKQQLVISRNPEDDKMA